MEYKNNYVTQFITRFDFDLLVSSVNFDKFEKSENKRLFELFPIKEISTVKQTSAKFNPDTNLFETIPVQDLHQIILWDRNKTVKVTIDTNKMIYESFKYNNFDQVKDHIEVILSILNKEFNYLTFKRIGMRYINNIRMAAATLEDCFQWQGLIHDDLWKMASIYDPKNSLIRQIQIHELFLDRGDLSLRIQTGFPNEAYPSRIIRKHFLIDIDCYTNNNENKSSYLTDIEKIHAEIGKKFEIYIGDELRRLMNE